MLLSGRRQGTGARSARGRCALAALLQEDQEDEQEGKSMSDTHAKMALLVMDMQGR